MSAIAGTPSIICLGERNSLGKSGRRWAPSTSLMKRRLRGRTKSDQIKIKIKKKSKKKERKWKKSKKSKKIKKIKIKSQNQNQIKSNQNQTKIQIKTESNQIKLTNQISVEVKKIGWNLNQIKIKSNWFAPTSWMFGLYGCGRAGSSPQCSRPNLPSARAGTQSWPTASIP